MTGEPSLKFRIPESSCKQDFRVLALFADGAKRNCLNHQISLYISVFASVRPCPHFIDSKLKKKTFQGFLFKNMRRQEREFCNSAYNNVWSLVHDYKPSCTKVNLIKIALGNKKTGSKIAYITSANSN